MWVFYGHCAHILILLLFYVQQAASIAIFMKHLYTDTKLIFYANRVFRVTYDGYLGCSNSLYKGCTLQMKVNPYERHKYKVCAEALKYQVNNTAYRLEFSTNKTAPPKVHSMVVLPGPYINSTEEVKIFNYKAEKRNIKICGLPGKFLNITMKSSNPSYSNAAVVLTITGEKGEKVKRKKDIAVVADKVDSDQEITHGDDMSEAVITGICFAFVAFLFGMGGIYVYYRRRRQRSRSSTSNSLNNNVLTPQQSPLVSNVNVTSFNERHTDAGANEHDPPAYTTVIESQPIPEPSAPFFTEQGSEQPAFVAPPPSYEEVMSGNYAVQ